MSEGYFSGDAQVLLANGGYKNIAQIKPGDFVLNMRNEPVKVLKVRQVPKAGMLEVRHQNWYAPFYCTGDLQLLVAENLSDKEPQIAEMKWVAAKELSKDMLLTSENNIYQSLLPAEFNVPLTTSKKVLMLKPNHDLGLAFGLYAGFGSVNKDRVEFRFGPNDALIEQVSKLLQELFDAETSVVKDEYCYQVHTNSSHMVELFSEFGPKIRRQIPRKYWSTNDDYVHGLFEGLIEYDPDNNVSRYIPVTKEMAEVFLWVCTLLGLTFENDTPRIDKLAMRVYPLFVRHEQDDSYIGKITNVDLEANVEQVCWNLEVECSTNSFIVNNLVVRSFPTEPEPETEDNSESIQDLVTDRPPTPAPVEETPAPVEETPAPVEETRETNVEELD